jgi:hypothetical protein
VIQRRKFDNLVYDLLEETRTFKEAEKKQVRFWKDWNTNYKITKSTHPSDPLPFKLWGRNDPAVLWKQRRSEILNGVDTEIRELIRDLNDNGIYTVESCSGHKTQPGIIWLSKHTFSQQKFAGIMKKHGMSNVRRRSQPLDGNRDHWVFIFDLPGHVGRYPTQKRNITKKKRVTPRSIIAGSWGV